jgi:excisionase family DNA binding protein
MNKDVSKAFLKASDLARYCLVDLKTVHKWVQIGALPHFRTPGGHIRFHRDEVERFVREQGFLRKGEKFPNE